MCDENLGILMYIELTGVEHLAVKINIDVCSQHVIRYQKSEYFSNIWHIDFNLVPTPDWNLLQLIKISFVLKWYVIRGKSISVLEKNSD